jgi:hypothetical protein
MPAKATVAVGEDSHLERIARECGGDPSIRCGLLGKNVGVIGPQGGYSWERRWVLLGKEVGTPGKEPFR